ncbi:hypothetical protein BJ684DRAFT_16136 [Piptocephalis cylindrospora]|uniref:Uncharacterized protein n=1 Tax=Piptocephalis cylindrospora TaxID=1907219 RepID=A0A4P9Y3E9_9FUNG|nr:hypothetical protein BJ684DRAFT_16136 [Piptocephalis cylindrospora]|eukprot:RKP13468.1 hypothetical protein BJ684DRAFT_16136 [Piptocephalis cylindrospora]
MHKPIIAFFAILMALTSVITSYPSSSTPSVASFPNSLSRRFRSFSRLLPWKKSSSNRPSISSMASSTASDYSDSSMLDDLSVDERSKIELDRKGRPVLLKLQWLRIQKAVEVKTKVDSPKKSTPERSCVWSIDEIMKKVKEYEHVAEQLLAVRKNKDITTNGSDKSKAKYFQLLSEEESFHKWISLTRDYTHCLIPPNPTQILDCFTKDPLQAFDMAIRFARAYWKVYGIPFPSQAHDAMKYAFSWLELCPTAIRSYLDHPSYKHLILPIAAGCKSRFDTETRNAIPLINSLSHLFEAVGSYGMIRQSKSTSKMIRS